MTFLKLADSASPGVSRLRDVSGGVEGYLLHLEQVSVAANAAKEQSSASQCE